jgi:hypothetical protein
VTYEDPEGELVEVQVLASYTPLTRLLLAFYTPPTRLLHASYSPFTRLVHASYTPLIRLVPTCGHCLRARDTRPTYSRMLTYADVC